VGTFSIPFAIMNDLAFLDALPVRIKRAGIIEAIKVALIRGGDFFRRIEARAHDLAMLDNDAIEMVVRRSAELHVDHIASGGDPFEMGSSRPLDFGHWLAQKLEQLSDFALTHGEAVAIGMAVDLRYAAKVGLRDAEACDRILGVIERVGFVLSSPFLQPVELLLQGLEEFREHLGGVLTIPMVTAIGTKTDVHEMNTDTLREVIEAFAYSRV